jgi:hypothetical protein
MTEALSIEGSGNADVRKPEGFTVERDGPRTFSFDDVSYPCFSLESQWNGFDNVSISPETRDLIVSDFRAAGDDESADDMAEIEADEDGRVCLGWGHATSLDEPTAT